MSLYVPCVIRLEVKKGASFIDFSENSINVDYADIQRVYGKRESVFIPPPNKIGYSEESPSIAEKTRRRLMSGRKKRVKTNKDNRDAPLAPEGYVAQPGHREHRGLRTYSEVVVETLEGSSIRVPDFGVEKSRTDSALDSLESQSTSRASKAGSEPVDFELFHYYYGNPGVEKTEGILHFYKYNDEMVARRAQCRMLCMIAVPAQVTVRHLVTFIGSMVDRVERMKIVRDSNPNQYSVILKFKTHNDTVVFFEEFNGLLFNSLETARCALLFVDRIECASEEEMDSFVCSPLTELPTCAVCLDRMDESVISILCSHAFHAECLQKWTSDTTCPVCRYMQTPELVAEQRCSDCGQSSDLWLCLICGNIGCGRYAEAHAYKHFESTSHTFSLQVGGERVWDYAGDNYVHRLIQSDSDGKLVQYERERGGDSLDEKEKNEKLDGLKMEYTCLLTNQLDNQRKFFESRVMDVERAMNNMEAMSKAQMLELEEQLSASRRESAKLRADLDEVLASRAALEKKHVQTVAKLTKTQASLKEEETMNGLLLKDQASWKQKLATVEEKQKNSELKFSTQVKDLEEQMRDVMLHMEATNKLAQSNLSQAELDGCQVQVSSPPSGENSRSKRRSSHKK